MAQASEREFAAERDAGHAPRSVGDLPVLRAAATFCLYEVSYCLAYRYGMSFNHVTASPFWFTDSVLPSAALLTRCAPTSGGMLSGIKHEVAMPKRSANPTV
jgi:hypothetical protein